MRMNNLSARLKINDWLGRAGHEPLPANLSYEEFATVPRKITAVRMFRSSFQVGRMQSHTSATLQTV
ncbi:hypothetical protein G6L30_08545 [Agrobacterium rhizogenes]|nr:hypothetical protein [Rhizobium rhizogenes]